MRTKDEIAKYHKKWYQKNKEKQKEFRKKYRQDNKEKVAEGKKKYYQENKERIKEIHKKYSQSSKAKEQRKIYNKKPEVKERQKEYWKKPKVKEYKRKWQQENKEKLNEISKKYYQTPKAKEYHKKYNQDNKNRRREYKKNRKKTNIQFSLGVKLRKQFAGALNRYTTTGKYQSSSKYGIDWKPIIKKLIETKPRDFKYRKYHIDHIIPCINFNLEDLEQIKKCFSPENLRWLSAEDNFSKHTKLDWVKTIIPPILLK